MVTDVNQTYYGNRFDLYIYRYESLRGTPEANIMLSANYAQ